eukprot:ANDGO_03496.mRNA.1 hypothetical protein GUITHDRAFT_146346
MLRSIDLVGITSAYVCSAALVDDSGFSVQSHFNSSFAVLTGSVGFRRPPHIVEFSVSDPDYSDGVLSVGDEFLVRFSEYVSIPAAPFSDFLEFLPLDRSLAVVTNWTVSWSNYNTTLRISVDALNFSNPLAFAPVIGMTSVKLKNNIVQDLYHKSIADDRDSLNSFVVLTGDFGRRVGPNVSSLVVYDRFSTSEDCGRGDVLVACFDYPTNSPRISSKIEIDLLFAFSSSIGDDYAGLWTNASCAEIEILISPVNSTFSPGLLSIFVIGPLRDFRKEMRPSVSSSAVLSGSCGLAMPNDSIVSLVAADPDNLDGVFSAGDTIDVQFNFNATMLEPFGNGTCGSERTNLDAVQAARILAFSHPFLVNFSLEISPGGKWTIRVLDVDVNAAPPPFGRFFLQVSSACIMGLHNASNANLRSPPLSGNWGELMAPRIVDFLAHDPDDGDNVLSQGDQLTVVFDRSTNSPTISASEELLRCFAFSPVLDIGLSAVWNDSRSVLLTVVQPLTASESRSYFLLGSLQIFVRRECFLRDDTNTSSVSESVSPVLRGNWGRRGPVFVDAPLAFDPGNRDAVFSNGDAIRLEFSEPTNTPPVNSKAEVDCWLSFSEPIGSAYHGFWSLNGTVLTLVVTEVGFVDAPRIGLFTVSVIGLLQSASGVSLVSNVTSPPLKGDWGTSRCLFVSSFSVVDTGSPSACQTYGSEDIFYIFVSRPVDMPLNSSVTLSHFNDHFEFSDNSLLDSSSTVTYVEDTQGAYFFRIQAAQSVSLQSRAPKIGVSRIGFRPSSDLMDAAHNCLPGNNSKAVLSGSYGVGVPVTIARFFAADLDDLDRVPSVGDVIWVEFSSNTSMPSVFPWANFVTVFSLDAMLSKSAVFAASWTRPDLLRLDVMAVLDESALISFVSGVAVKISVRSPSLLDTSRCSSLVFSISPQLTGNWGRLSPQLQSISFDDPDDLDAILSVGDRLCLYFDSSTNQPTLSGGLLEYVDFVSNPNALNNATFSSLWLNTSTLCFTITSLPAAVVLPVIGFDVLHIRSSAGIQLAGHGSLNSTSSAVLAGNFGTLPGPAIISFVASDPDNLDGIFSAFDVFLVTFDGPTNCPNVNSKFLIDQLILFSGAGFGADYNATWLTLATLKIVVLNVGTLTRASSPRVGSYRISIRSSGNLKNSMNTSLPSSAWSPVLSGSLGAYSGPSIVDFVISDPIDVDHSCGAGDVLEIHFSEPTNMPPLQFLAGSTPQTKYMSPLDSVFSFTASIGASYRGYWHNASVARVEILLSSSVVSSIQIGSLRVTSLANGDIANQGGFSQASASVSPALRGSCGYGGPSITSLTAIDADDADGVFSADDELVITFSEDTNTPDISRMDLVDEVFYVPPPYSLGTNYTGEWADPRTARIHVRNAAIPAGFFYPLVGALDFFIQVKNTSGLADGSGLGNLSFSLSPALAGSWGNRQGPYITSIIADGDDAVDGIYGAGDVLYVTFNESTNEPPMTTHAQLVAGFFVCHTPPSCIDPNGHTLGTLTSGRWVNSSVLLITILIPGTTIASTPIIGRTLIAPRQTANLRNSGSWSLVSSSPSPSLVGDWGLFPGPRIIEFSCRDPTDSDYWYGNGDEIMIRFDSGTNTPPVSTMSQFDALFNFSHVIGKMYKAMWKNDRVLIISVSDVTNGTLQLNETQVSILSSIRNSAGISSVRVGELSPFLSGDFGKKGPFILSYVVSAPNPATDGIFGETDVISIEFSTPTNVPPLSTKALVDSVFFFKPPIGQNYSGSWTSSTTAVITITAFSGVPRESRPQIGASTVRVRETLRNDSLTSYVSVSESPLLSGFVGNRSGPAIVSFDISDPDNSDRVLSIGDVLDICFSEPTSIPLLSSTAAVNSVFSFSASIGAAYSGLWSNSSCARIALLNISGNDIRLGNLSVSVQSGVLYDASSVSLATTPVFCCPLQGNMGLQGPQIVSFVADDPDQADGIVSSGDTLKICFDLPTNRPEILAHNQVISIFRFSAPIGQNSTGTWETDCCALITIEDATTSSEFETAVGHLRVSVIGNLRDSNSSLLPSNSSSGPVTGTFGDRAGPRIVFFDVFDTDDLDRVWSAGDVLRLCFNESTNTPEISTPEAVSSCFAFSPVLTGVAFSGTWFNSSCADLTVISLDFGSAPPLLHVTIVEVRFSAALRDAKNVSRRSTSQSPPLTGNFGRFPPNISGFEVSDPDDLDRVLSSGDVLTIEFDIPTNTPAVSSSSEIFQVFGFSNNHSFASALQDISGLWVTDRTVVLNLTFRNSPMASTLILGQSVVFVLPSGRLYDRSLSSIPSYQTSPPLSGSFGRFPPQLVKMEANDPDNSDIFYSVGDEIVLTFDVPTCKPDLTSKVNVDAMLNFSIPIGLMYDGLWDASGKVLRVRILIAYPYPADVSTNALLFSRLNVTFGGNFLWGEDRLLLPLVGFSNVNLTGSFGERASPIVSAFVASDPDDGDFQMYSIGDVLDLQFSEATNQPPLFQYLVFSHSVGILNGYWLSPSIFRLVVLNVSHANVTIGNLSVAIPENANLRSAGNVSYALDCSGVVLAGNFGRLPPHIVASYVYDPADDDNVWNTEDVLQVVFNSPTNRPNIGSSSNVNSLILIEDLFGVPLLPITSFVGYWNNEGDVLTLVVQVAGAPIVPGLHVVRLRTSGNLRDSSGVSLPSSARSPAISGNVGRFPPTILAFVADDPDDLDRIYSDDDTLMIVFDRPTNQPPLSNLSSVLVFSNPSSVATNVSASWLNSSTILIKMLTVIPDALLIGNSFVSVLSSANVTDPLGILNPCNSSSPFLSGDFGRFPLRVVSFSVRDDDNTDIYFGIGDEFVLDFEGPTNQPFMGSKSLVDSQIAFSTSIGDNYFGYWESSSRLVIQVLAESSSPVYGKTNATNVFLFAHLNATLRGLSIQDNLLFLNPSCATTPALQGTFGERKGPRILAFIAADPDDNDFQVWSVDDTLTLLFSEDTNMVDIAPFLEFSDSVGVWRGIWVSPKAYTLTITDVSNSLPIIGSSNVTLRDSGGLRSAGNGSYVTHETSPPLAGTFGRKPPQILSCHVWDSTDGDHVFGPGDLVQLVFDSPTNRLDVQSVDNASLYFQMLLPPQNLSATFTGSWWNDTVLLLNVSGFSGIQPVVNQSRFRPLQFGNTGVQDPTLYSIFSTQASPPCEGTFGRRAPFVVSLQALDPYNDDRVWDEGDKIRIHFNRPTNQPLVNNKTAIDNLVRWIPFPLANSYNGEWLNSSVLEITFRDVLSTGPLIHNTTIAILPQGRLQDSTLTSLIANETSAVSLSGNLGLLGPQIRAFWVRDPTNSSVYLQDGDQFIIDWEMPTSQPPLASKALVDLEFNFSMPLGLNYSGSWLSSSRLAITVLAAWPDYVSVPSTLDSFFANLTVSVLGRSIRNASLDLVPSLARTARGALGGSFGYRLGPSIVSVVCDDPDDGDFQVFGAGDTVTILFSEATSMPSGIGSFLTFNQPFGQFVWTWADNRTLVLDVTDGQGKQPDIASLRVSVPFEADLRAAGNVSLPSNTTSAVGGTRGDWGRRSPIPIAAWVDDPDNADYYFSAGDAVYVMFDMPTNQLSYTGTSVVADCFVFQGLSSGTVVNATGAWHNATTLLLTVTAVATVNGKLLEHEDVVGLMAVSVLSCANVTEHTSYSLPASSVSSPNVTGTVGLQAPFVVKWWADDPDDGDRVWSDGDELFVLFNRPTNTPIIASFDALQRLLGVVASTTRSGVSNGIGLNATAWWQNSTLLVVHLLNVSAVGDFVVMQTRVCVFWSGGLRDHAGRSLVSNQTSGPVLDGDVGLLGPQIRAFWVRDPTNSSVYLQDGDQFIIDWEMPTSQPPLASKALVDLEFNFSMPLGLNYSGSWLSSSRLAITVLAAWPDYVSVPSTLDSFFANLTVSVLGRSIRNASLDLVPSLARTARGALGGSFGYRLGPSIVSVVCDDPDDGDFQVFGAGDTVTILFSEATSMPSGIGSFLTFNQPFGQFVWTWADNRTLVLDVTDGQGKQPDIASLRVSVPFEADLRAAGNVSLPSNTTSAVGGTRGDFGLCAPKIQFFVVYDLFNADYVFSTSDRFVLVFDVPTNQMDVSSPQDVEKLFAFYPPLNADLRFCGAWLNSSAIVFEAQVSNFSSPPIIGSQTICTRPLSGIRDSHNSSVDVGISCAVLSGDFGRMAPYIVSSWFDDPDDADRYWSSGDMLFVAFDRATSSPPFSSLFTVDDLFEFQNIRDPSLPVCLDWIAHWMNSSLVKLQCNAAVDGQLIPNVAAIAVKSTAGLTSADGISFLSSAGYGPIGGHVGRLGPQIAKFCVRDVLNDDIHFGQSDCFEVWFDLPTNRPELPPYSLFNFSLPDLAKNFTWSWHNSSVYEFCASTPNFELYPPDVETANQIMSTLVISVQCDLRSADLYSVPSRSLSFLSGSFGDRSGPRIIGFEVFDPDDLDRDWSTGDVLILTFSEATNTPQPVSIFDLLMFSDDPGPLTYHWQNSSTLVMTSLGHNSVSSFRLGVSCVSVLSSVVHLRDSLNKSLASIARSSPLSGTFGRMAPVMTSLLAVPSTASLDARLSVGDRFRIVFDVEMAELPVQSKDHVDSLFRFNDPQFYEYILEYVGRWMTATELKKNHSVLEITILAVDASKFYGKKFFPSVGVTNFTVDPFCNASLSFFGRLQVSSLTAQLFDLKHDLLPCTSISPFLIGSFGDRRSPAVLRLFAEDTRGDNDWYNVGDKVYIEFDEPTNSPNLSAQSLLWTPSIAQELAFQWRTPTLLEILIVNVTESVPVLGSVSVVFTDCTIRSEDFLSMPTQGKYELQDGNWGVFKQSILSGQETSSTFVSDFTSALVRMKWYQTLMISTCGILLLAAFILELSSIIRDRKKRRTHHTPVSAFAWNERPVEKSAKRAIPRSDVRHFEKGGNSELQNEELARSSRYITSPSNSMMHQRALSPHAPSNDWHSAYVPLPGDTLDEMLGKIVEEEQVEVFEGQIIRLDQHGHYIMFGERVSVFANSADGFQLWVEMPGAIDRLGSRLMPARDFLLDRCA